MGEITPKNEGNAGSHGGWLVIYYFKLFQVSNHHRDHVPLYIEFSDEKERATNLHCQSFAVGGLSFVDLSTTLNSWWFQTI